MTQSPIMSLRTTEIIARDKGLHKFDRGIFTVKSGVTTMVPGQIVTTYGETGPDIDIHTDGDYYATGIVLHRKNRAISEGGDVIDTIDTPFSAGSEVVVLLFGCGYRADVYMWLTGVNTGDGAGAVRRGAEVWLPDTTATNLIISNQTLGAGLCIVLEIDIIAGMTVPWVKIGTLVEDATIGASGAGMAGIIAKVSIL